MRCNNVAFLKKQNQITPTNDHFETTGPGPHLKSTNNYTKNRQYFPRNSDNLLLNIGVIGQMEKEFHKRTRHSASLSEEQ